jgi:shikimate kinase
MHDKAGKPQAGLSPPPSGIRSVFLIGFMGAGKTSVGRALSQRLGWEFVDLDERIQAREGRTIEEIFEQSGESGFREVEHYCLRWLLSEPDAYPRIVALGGGAYVQTKNKELLAHDGITVVFLDAPVEELFRRCQQENVIRPLCQDIEQFRGLLKKRRPAYAKADLLLDTSGKTIKSVAEEVAQRLGLG